jgi:molybdate transport system ATP-binding protein
MVLLAEGRVLAQGPVEALAARTDLPLAARRDAGALLTCRIAAHDQARGLTQLDFPGGRFAVPLRAEPIGSQARIRLRARDVAVATEPPRGISTQNVLAAQLVSVGDAASSPEVFLQLALGPSIILARVTRDSIARLGLRPGLAVWAVIKAVTFDHAAPPPP